MVAPYATLSGSSSYGPTLSSGDVDKPIILPDVFHIDDLLDFSNEDIAGPIVGGPLQLSSGLTVESSAEPSICCSSSVEAHTEMQTAPAALEVDDIDHKTDLCVPCDDLAELEWLSSFVEDSFSMGDAPELLSTCGGFAMAGDERGSMTKRDPYQKSSPVSVLENSATLSELTGADYRDYSVPGRARSKRSRTGARIWTSTILPSSSSVTSFDSMGNDESYAMSFSPIASRRGGDDSQDGDDESQSSKRCKPTKANTATTTTTTTNTSLNLNNNAAKGRKKGQDITQPWRCMHCQTQRTPQWRTGPMGPKTLCNACGVRYKSGRLLPEYRPAGSPSYMPHKHSHSHKKVLEMRRERELRNMQSSASQNHHNYAAGGQQSATTREKGGGAKGAGGQDPPAQDHAKTPLGGLGGRAPGKSPAPPQPLPKTPDFQSFAGGGAGSLKIFSHPTAAESVHKPLKLDKALKLDLPKFAHGHAMEMPKCFMSTAGVDDIVISRPDMRGLVSP